MSALLGIYGTGGCGRGIMPFARVGFSAAHGEGSRAVFIDDRPSQGSVNGRDVVTLDAFLRLPASERFVNIAVADSRARAEIWARCEGAGLRAWTAVADSAVRMDDVAIGAGAAISPFVTLTSNIRIGRHFHANLYSYVEHDCVVGDFVTLAPGAKVNGNVVIEDYAYIGSGAIIKQGVPGAPLVIGASATIGMGAVVLESVAPGAVMVGNPARRLR